MDYPYDQEGNCRKDEAKFYVPNDHVFHLAEKYSQIIPACSIHPARKDAVEELERCAEKGAKVLKLLPNCHDVDCSDNQYRSFWEKTFEIESSLPCPYGRRIFSYPFSMQNLLIHEYFAYPSNAESK